MRCQVTLVAVLLSAMVPALAGRGEVVPLPNPGFEQAGGGKVDPFAAQSVAPNEGVALAGLPDGWSAYQWGAADSRFRVGVEKGAGHTGAGALRAENLDPSARGGVYTHVKLQPGAYRISVWARAEKGKTARARVYLATAYSRPLKVTDEWRRLTFENSLDKPIERAEINVQNASGEAGVVWLDDVEIRRTHSAPYVMVPDTRKERPRTLLFSPMNVSYLSDTAKEWGERGFRGFLFDGIMASWPSDVWAVDGDAKTRGEDDALLKELRACNDECRRYGIDSNFVKVAFYDKLPDWSDDAVWAKVAENFRQGARFARLSGCAGVAIDTEYVAEQYDPGWEGYKKSPIDPKALKRVIQERWRAVTEAMLKEYPEMVLLTLPEGMLYYGEYYFPIFLGMLQGCAQAKAPGGLHVMTEGTYHMTHFTALANYPGQVAATLEEECPKELLAYWRKRCSVAMGVWPLGYYRDITDASGKSIGYGGKKEVFGDKVIGSYSDKSEWYSPTDFVEQMAGVNTFCPKYNWIYGHGCVFWQWTEEQAKRYSQCAHKSVSNATLPTVANLADYFAAIARPKVVRRRD